MTAKVGWASLAEVAHPIPCSCGRRLEIGAGSWIGEGSASMKISDITGRDLILGRLAARDAAAAVRELLEHIAKCRGLTLAQVDLFHSEVLKRHSKNPCGLSGGLAFPNARIPGFGRPLLAVGASDGGLDLQGRDGLPVHVLFLFLGSADPGQEERRMLRALSQAFATSTLSQRLCEAATTDEIWDCLVEIDQLRTEKGGLSDENKVVLGGRRER